MICLAIVGLLFSLDTALIAQSSAPGASYVPQGEIVFTRLTGNVWQIWVQPFAKPRIAVDQGANLRCIAAVHRKIAKRLAIVDKQAVEEQPAARIGEGFEPLVRDLGRDQPLSRGRSRPPNSR